MTAVFLLTGGRAPATLDLARRLHEAGAQVHLAESLPWSATHFSRAVRSSHRVRAPRQDPGGFSEDLRRLCRELHVDQVLPTCEEVFWVARDGDLPGLTETRERLRRAHDKHAFVKWAEDLGLGVPPTDLVEDVESMGRAIAAHGGPEHVVVKPVFSRFGSSAFVRPSPAVLARVEPSPERPWVVQAFVAGDVACSWGFAHSGRLTVHTAYRARFTAGPGSAVHFVSLEDEAVLDWVRRFAEATGWSGHLAFDFVLTADGPVAIECNPRLTSGVHLLDDGPALLRALTQGSAPLLRPEPGASAQVGAAMWLYAGPRAWRRGELGAWWAAATSAREVSWDPKDVRPFLLQPLSIGRLLARAAAVGEGVLDATTWDIRWDGQEG